MRRQRLCAPGFLAEPDRPAASRPSPVPRQTELHCLRYQATAIRATEPLRCRQAGYRSGNKGPVPAIDFDRPPDQPVSAPATREISPAELRFDVVGGMSCVRKQARATELPRAAFRHESPIRRLQENRR